MKSRVEETRMLRQIDVAEYHGQGGNQSRVEYLVSDRSWKGYFLRFCLVILMFNTVKVECS